MILPHAIRSARLVARPATADDLPALDALLREPAVAVWWGDEAITEVRALLDGADTSTQVVTVVDGSPAGGANRVIGLAYLTEQPDPGYRHGSIDVTLATAAQDRGLGTELVQLLAAWLIGGRGHHRATIDPSADNPRAIACYRKAGFRDVGIMRAYERRADGAWHDGLLMDLLADELVRPAGLDLGR